MVNISRDNIVGSYGGAQGGTVFIRGMGSERPGAEILTLIAMMAKKLGKQGKVVLRLSINEKGKLMNVEVVEPADYGFTESAMEAVKMSTFLPAHENGVGIASKALLTIQFALKRN